MFKDNSLFEQISYPLERTYTPELFDKGIEETVGYFDPYRYLKVLKGESIAYHAKQVLPIDSCQKICQAYQLYEGKTTYNVKPAIEAIGKALYLAQDDWLDGYFAQSPETQKSLAELFHQAGTPNYPQEIFDLIKSYFQFHGGVSRKLQHKEQEGFFGIMRSWGNNGVDEKGRATRVHEDRLQIRLHCDQLETKKVFNSTMTSTCIYYSNGHAGGELFIYDCRPGLEDAVHEELNSEYGYGFADEITLGLNKITLLPQAGDIITFCADRLHVVEGIQGGNRISSTFFSALQENKRGTNLIWS